MGSLSRIVVPGLPHHVTQWGNRREAIFFEDGDHEIYLDLLGEQTLKAGGQLRPFAGPSTAIYQNLARNRSFTGNVMFSPSAYMLFSLEYRRLASSPVNGKTEPADIIGFA
jgi:hypothetical protein